MPFVDPSLRAFAPPSQTEDVSTIYGQETPKIYQNLAKTFVLLGEWIQLMSAAVEIVTPHNTGYKQKMLMVRYYPERVKSRKVPMFLPSKPNQFEPHMMNSAEQMAWRFSTQKQIRQLLSTAHVTSFDEFFVGIFYMVETVQNLVAVLGNAKLTAEPIEDVNLNAVVQQAAVLVDRNRAKLMTAAAFYQCIVRIRNSSAAVVYPEGVNPDQVDTRTIFYQLVIQKLQTSFVEGAMQYFSGEVPSLPDGSSLQFVYTVQDTRYYLDGIEALRGRFDRRARKYWSPFSWSHGRRGIEVINPDDFFEAPYLQQMRDRGALNSFNVEMAARALFEAVHTLYNQRYQDHSPYFATDILLPNPEGSENTFSIEKDGFGPGLPVKYNVIEVLRYNSGTALDRRFVFERNARLGQTSLGLFPSKYSDKAITLYNTMQQHAAVATGREQYLGRYSGLLRENAEVMMQFLDEDLHPSNPEGTLQNAQDNYERAMAPEEDEAASQAGPAEDAEDMETAGAVE